MALGSWPGDGVTEMLAALSRVGALTPESVQGANVPGALPLLVQGMVAGAFLTLACHAGIRYALSGAWPFAWLSLTALAAAGYQLLLGDPGVTDLFPVLRSGAHLAEPLVGSAMVMCFVGFVCSLAQRNSAFFPSIQQATIGASALVILNLSALWLPHTAAQLALLLAAVACAYFVVLCLRLRGRVAMAGLLSATSLVALLHLLLRLDSVAMLIPQPTDAHGQLRTSATEYLLIALANLAILALWLRHVGNQRLAAGSVRARWLAKENLRVSREVARQMAASNQALAAAQEKSTQQIQTLSYVAHDLRAPLATILGYVRLLRGSNRRPKAEHLDAIKRSVAFQLALIDDVLDYAKIELSPLYLAPASTNLAAFLNELVSYASMLSQPEHNRFVYAPPAVLPARVEVDGRRLQQVLLNLLSNAAKFTSRGTISLTVDAQREADPPRWRVRFCVQDEGIGIKPADQGVIFDAFRQLERAHGGVGLGLFIAVRIVQAMGSELTVSSVPGEGSAFSFELELPELDGALIPARPCPQGDSTPAAQAALPAALPAAISAPPSRARLELAMLVRDGRLTDIEDWLLRAMQLHPGFNDYYDEVRKAVLALDLARLEALAQQGPSVDKAR